MLKTGDFVDVYTLNFRGYGGIVWGAGRVVSVSACGDGVFISLETCNKEGWIGRRVEFDASDVWLVCPDCMCYRCECDERAEASKRSLADYYNPHLDG